MALQNVYDYFYNYDKETYLVMACKGHEPSEQDLAALERTLGFSLPAEFREFTMSPLGGLYFEVREEVWPSAKVFDVGPFWSFLRGILVYGIAENIPDFLDLRVQAKEFQEAGITDYVPFLKLNGDGDSVYCFDENGKIVLFSGDDDAPPAVFSGSFSELLMREIRELEERVEKKRRGADD